MLRTIDFREALQLRRDKQKAEGTLPTLDFDVPQLTDYQVAKDIWFWFARQQTTTTSNGAIAASSERLSAAAAPNVASVRRAETCCASLAGGLSMVLSEHDKAVCSRLGQVLRHVPCVVRFLLLFHAAVATTPDEERICLSRFGSSTASPETQATKSSRLALLLFNALELHQTLRELVWQDLCIARKQLDLSAQRASLEVDVFFEDFKVFGCSDVLHQLAGLTPSVEGGSIHVDVAENIDGDRVVAVRVAAQNTVPRDNCTVQVSDDREESLAIDQSEGGGSSKAESARNAADDSHFAMFTREAEWSEVDEQVVGAAASTATGEAAEHDPIVSHGRVAAAASPAEFAQSSTRDFYQVFAEYRDKLYSGRYEFMEDIGVVECSK